MASMTEITATILGSAGFTWSCYKGFDNKMKQNKRNKQNHVKDMQKLYLFWKTIRKKEVSFSIRRIFTNSHISYVVKGEHYTLYIDENEQQCTFSVGHPTRGIIMKNHYWHDKTKSYWKYEDALKKNKAYNEFSIHHMFLEGMRTYWERQEWKKQVVDIKDVHHSPFARTYEAVKEKEIKKAIRNIFPYYVPLYLFQTKLSHNEVKKYTEILPKTVEDMIKEYLSFSPFYQSSLKSHILSYLHDIRVQYKHIYDKVNLYS
ncbi:hypothetical protein CN918_25640 [Priestia megaterium]|nr:hypothetical protein CN918_25640 [Priestia megaterium]